MDNNQALHQAIAKEDMKKFLQLLDQPEIDLNQENSEGNTPLTESINRNNPVMAKCLIEAGCDVNLMGNYETPLRLVIRNEYIHDKLDIVHMLITKVADINILSYWHCDSHLHTAVSNDENAEVTSMLLYYEADVNIKDSGGRTPLMKSFCDISRRHCQEVLLKYYDDFSCCDNYGRDALYLAVQMNSPFIVDLVERGADVNRGRRLIYLIVYTHNAEAFKLIWSRMNHKLVLERGDYDRPLFLHCLRCFDGNSNYEYLECLYLMLESPIAHLLIKDCIDYFAVNKYHSLVDDLLGKLVHRQVLPKDRLSLIYACLSFGVEIKIDDLQCAYEHCGFNEEFKALLYAGNLICSDYAEQIRHCMKEKYYTKGFSWLSPGDKQHLIRKTAQYYIRERLSGVSEFPSLLELSRNKAQKFIQKEFKIAKIYQFHDAVNCLKLPQIVKDMILLEKPIYSNLI